MADDPFSQIKWRVADEFPDIYADDACLALFVRLLIIGDQAWPASGTLPYGTRRKPLQRLVDAELIHLNGSHRFRVRGMDKERGRRRENASNAARTRWRNADA